MEPLFDVGQCTDKGNCRPQNEDSCGGDAQLGLWLVADGMGGHEHGEVASQLAVEHIAEQVRLGKSLEDSIRYSHQIIQNVSHSKGSSRPMGTTIVAVLFEDSRYQIAWVGDSRAYLADQHLCQLTRDHSLVQRLLDSGVVTEEEAKNHPNRNVITQSLGSTEMKSLVVDTVNGDLKAGQKLLLCSDGLNGELSDERIYELMNTPDTAQDLSERLVQAAKDAGGHDNISAIVISYPSESLNADETMVIKRAGA
ncbi:serine/threonine-protein phosphatase [Pseudomaricurvus alkylphenolicus]|nr:serine/threonine-protein phosphatase [Pseudomaricurvus alkylphenolicus]